MNLILGIIFGYIGLGVAQWFLEKSNCNIFWRILWAICIWLGFVASAIGISCILDIIL